MFQTGPAVEQNAPDEVPAGSTATTAFFTDYGLDGASVARDTLTGDQNDLDTYEMQLEAGQQVSFVMTPTSGSLQPRLTLFNPSASTIGLATGSAPGEPAVLQAVDVATSGSYLLFIESDNGQAGDYELECAGQFFVRIGVQRRR